MTCIIDYFFLSRVRKYISYQKIYKAGEPASSYTRFTKKETFGEPTTMVR